MRAAKVQASLRIRAVSPEPPLLAHTSIESRGTFRQKTRSLAPLNGWACAVKICHDGMLEDTKSLDAAHLMYYVYLCRGRAATNVVRICGPIPLLYLQVHVKDAIKYRAVYITLFTFVSNKQTDKPTDENLGLLYPATIKQAQQKMYAHTVYDFK